MQGQKSNTSTLKNNANNLPNNTDALSDVKLDILMQNHTKTKAKINI